MLHKMVSPKSSTSAHHNWLLVWKQRKLPPLYTTRMSTIWSQDVKPLDSNSISMSGLHQKHTSWMNHNMMGRQDICLLECSNYCCGITVGRVWQMQKKTCLESKCNVFNLVWRSWSKLQSLHNFGHKSKCRIYDFPYIFEMEVIAHFPKHIDFHKRFTSATCFPTVNSAADYINVHHMLIFRH